MAIFVFTTMMTQLTTLPPCACVRGIIMVDLLAIAKTDHQTAKFSGYTLQYMYEQSWEFNYRNHDSVGVEILKLKMKFATYRSVGFNYRSRRPTFKPQRTEETIASDEGAITQPPQAVKLNLEQKLPVC